MNNVNKFKSNLYTIWCLSKREFKIFFKDKSSLFFCFMAPVTFLLLYLLFLREVCMTSISDIVGNYIDIASSGLSLKEINSLLAGFIDSWMFSGVLALSSICVGLTANNILVSDREKGISKDLLTTPTNNALVTISYYLFNFLINVFICLVIYAVVLIFLACIGEFYLNTNDIFGLLGVLLFSSLLNTFIFTFFARFFKSAASYGTFTAVMNACMGFFIGAYLPTSIMPNYLQNFCDLFPGTHIANLFRIFLTRGSLDNITTALQNSKAENAEDIINQLRYYFNCDSTIFTTKVDTYVIVCVVIAFIILFLILNIIMDLVESNKRKIKFKITKK